MLVLDSQRESLDSSLGWSGARPKVWDMANRDPRQCGRES